MQQRSFLLGLGNQKCGTSWLHKYLTQNDNFDGGFAKEYHVWDAIDYPNKKQSSVGWRQGLFAPPNSGRRYRMRRNPSYYFDYFERRYSSAVTVSGDITPAYSGLSVSRLEFIRDHFQAKKIAVKAVILIRDPVSRIKSASRFNLDRQGQRDGKKYGADEYLQRIQSHYHTEHCRMRTSYHTGISNAWKVFGEANVYVGIYENMFESEQIESLSRFCGVASKPEFAQVYVNKTKGKPEDSLQLEAKIREAYQDVYDFCFENVPKTRELWRC